MFLWCRVGLAFFFVFFWPGHVVARLGRYLPKAAQPAAAAIGSFMAVAVTAAFVACPLYTYYAVHHGAPSQ